MYIRVLPMKITVFSTLRSRLIALILLILIAAFALILQTALQQRRLALIHTQENLFRLARHAVSEHEQLIEGARQLLVGLAHLPQVQNYQGDLCSRLFQKIVAELPTYGSLIAAKPNGDVFCRSAPASRPMNIADLSTFQRTIETRAFTVSELSSGPTSDKPAITFSYPSLDIRGNIKAYISIGMDLRWFHNVAAQANLPAGVSMSILDRNGTVVAHYPQSEREWMGDSVRDTPLMHNLLTRTQGMMEVTGPDGIERIQVFTALQGTEAPSLFVSVGVPHDVVYAAATNILTYNLLGLGTVGLLALAGAWFGSELFFLRRVNRLLEVTKQLALGNLGARSGLPEGRGEIHQLIRTIDELAESLERSMEKRTQAEQALRESEQLYRALVENVAEGIGINVGTRRVFANTALLKIHGLNDPAQMIGAPLDQFIFPEDRNLVIQRTLARQRGEAVPQVYEYRILRPDGSVRTVETSATPIVYQGRAAALVALRDRTEDKLAELLLRESENKFRSVVESATDAVVSADNQGSIIFFNKSAEQIFGYSTLEAIGKPLTLLMPERYHSAHHQGLIRYVSTGKASILGKTVEMTGRRKDGSEFPVDVSLAAWNNNGEPYFTAFIRDVTQRKRSLETITQLNHDLQIHTERLQAINEDLEAFSYSVSHDLRAPLRAIDGFSKILIEDFSSGLPDEVQRLLAVVRRNTEQMGRLIDDLLAFSRLSRTSFDSTTIDMAALTQDALEDLTKSAPERTLSVTVHPLAPAQGNIALIQQVMINLISNALKFSRERAQPKVEIGYYANGKENTYFVKDNGVGFDMTYADKLFGVFQRLHSAQEFDGYGVGLAIVKRIISRHNGRVWAEGKPDEGATFYFTLPSTDRAA
jgi:PAS domain S-box-containing protein